MTPTPKEKAKELVSHFYSILSGMELSYILKMISFSNGDSHYEKAKQCALVAVDEIMSIFNDYQHNKDKEFLNEWLYWIEVKKELEQL